jgi:hypothetical protein
MGGRVAHTPPAPRDRSPLPARAVPLSRSPRPKGVRSFLFRSLLSRSSLAFEVLTEKFGAGYGNRARNAGQADLMSLTLRLTFLGPGVLFSPRSTGPRGVRGLRAKNQVPQLVIGRGTAAAPFVLATRTPVRGRREIIDIPLADDDPQNCQDDRFAPAGRRTDRTRARARGRRSSSRHATPRSGVAATACARHETSRSLDSSSTTWGGPRRGRFGRAGAASSRVRS